jgi:RNA polymerase nonessential primary-like sigma factor
LGCFCLDLISLTIAPKTHQNVKVNQIRKIMRKFLGDLDGTRTRINDYPVLPQVEVRSLIATFQEGWQYQDVVKDGAATPEQKRAFDRGIRAKHKVILHNQRLVAKFVFKAKSTYPRSFDLAEAFHEGIIGLNRAIEKFDLTKNIQFSTYASWWVQCFVQRFIEETPIVHIPCHVHEKYNRIAKAHKKLRIKLDRPATAKEVAIEIGESEEVVAQILHRVFRAREVFSMDTTLGEDLSPAEVIPCMGDTPEDHVIVVEHKEYLEKLLSSLKEEEREIIILAFGLQDGVERSIKTIANEMGVNRNRVRNAKKRAMHRLRLATSA